MRNPDAGSKTQNKLPGRILNQKVDELIIGPGRNPTPNNHQGRTADNRYPRDGLHRAAKIRSCPAVCR